MGKDKGQLQYLGEPQACRAVQMLQRLCTRTYVSVRSDQAQLDPYAELPLIVDDGELRGPAAGLLAAWTQWPNIAWLTLATDLPLVGSAMLSDLIGRRASELFATAFRHPDGTPEPLCTIWEPAARAVLLERVRNGDHSLRRLLEGTAAELLDAASPPQLVSVDSEREYQAALERLATSTLA